MMGSIVRHEQARIYKISPTQCGPEEGRPASSTCAHVEAQFHGTISKFTPAFILNEKRKRKKQKKKVSILSVLLLALLAAGFSTNNSKLCWDEVKKKKKEKKSFIMKPHLVIANNCVKWLICLRVSGTTNVRVWTLTSTDEAYSQPGCPVPPNPTPTPQLLVLPTWWQERR